MKGDAEENSIPHPERMARELFATLDIVGCNPTSIQKVKWTFHFCCQILWCCVVFGYNICCYETTPEFIEHIMYTAIIMQVIIKFLICRIYSSNLSANLNTLFHVFWTDKDIVEQGRDSYIKLNKTLHMIIIGYKKLFFYSIFLVALETQISTPGMPVFTVWSPKTIDFNNSQPYGLLWYAGELISIAGCVLVGLVPLDSIYILLVGSAYIQFDCLKSTMRNMKCLERDEAYNTLVRCVKHHNLILVYLKKVEQVYTLSLLSQLCAILFTICLAIYISTLDLNLAVRPFLYAMLTSSQLFIYCLGGELITEQGISLSDAAYESNWWNIPDKSFRGGLVLMIQRSQRPIKITAGNVFILSMELFTKVLKASVSFMTMLKTTTIKEK